MTDRKHHDQWLETQFDAARRDTPVPSADFLSRIVADAETVLAEQGTSALAQPKRRGVWAGLFDMVGGWPALGSFATAALAGVWIGFSQPGGLDTFSSEIWPSTDIEYSVSDLLPSYDLFLSEGDA